MGLQRHTLTSRPSSAKAKPSGSRLRSCCRYVVDRFHPDLTLACSFQKEDTVLLDMLLATEPSARVFALDTHVLFPETYAALAADREALRHRRSRCTRGRRSAARRRSTVTRCGSATRTSAARSARWSRSHER